MFAELKVSVLAMVENMAYFRCDAGKKYNIFGEYIAVV
jgi:Mrp family chromosome partitioning ATPase